MKKILRLFIIGSLITISAGSVTSCSISFKPNFKSKNSEAWENNYKFLNDILSNEVLKKIRPLKNDESIKRIIKKIIKTDLDFEQDLNKLKLTDGEKQIIKEVCEIFLKTYDPVKYLIENVSNNFIKMKLITKEVDYEKHQSALNLSKGDLKTKMYKSSYLSELNEQYLKAKQEKSEDLEDIDQELNDLYSFNFDSRFLEKWPENIVRLMEEWVDLEMVYLGPWYISRANYYASLIKKINFLEEFFVKTELYLKLTENWAEVSKWWPINVEI